MNDYVILQRDNGYYVARPVHGGGWLTIAGPYNTQYEAEVEARRRANARRAA